MTEAVYCTFEEGPYRIKRIIDGNEVHVIPTSTEKLIDLAVVELTAMVEVNDNNLWYITSETPTQSDYFTFVLPGVDGSVMNMDKGAFCLNPLIWPVSSVRIPAAVEANYARMGTSPWGIKYWLNNIKQTDANNFTFCISTYDVGEELGQVEVIFDNELNYGLPEPAPSTFTLDPEVINLKSRIFTKFNLTFPSDPAGAVDQTYTLEIRFKTTGGALIEQVFFDVMVEGT